MLINLYAEMKKAHITQKEIANHLQLSSNTVSAKMTGRIDFTVSEIIAIRDAFFPQCSIEYLTIRS